MPALPQKIKDHLDAKALAVLTTLTADGSPHSAPVWATYDGDDLLVSTTQGRQKSRNLERDPRVSVVVVDPANPFSWTGLMGRAEMTVDESNLINRLSHLYLGEDYPAEPAGTVRVVVRIRPERVFGQ